MGGGGVLPKENVETRSFKLITLVHLAEDGAS